ncbi:noggin-like [Carcharodon carcharias]|uniref:noggin-like n=1 Tax=Carcharodon carcharias TaxID=13397 RepID=UPI001B7E25C9|nr:noggin-like [Carcharodon carcharias]
MLTLYLGLWSRSVSGQHYLQLRPAATQHPPLLELWERPDPELDPKDSDLDEVTLRLKLARDLDPDFMSPRFPGPEPVPRWDRERHCRWIPVRYLIISACSCSS